ncbi:helix-turn-helix domain-containing protein [Zoogloea sp.]|uniref:helix-turn-helix domain-containing protein n=1 Tax=Zoogloea sp. TaxID=49181 RepID=UPI0025EC32C5|nr:helix-turn-helix domain-containing protein [Zoogloea sp.]MCK6395595.1 excisionase family DNA-binding protein [Zoogloea sp.]
MTPQPDTIRICSTREASRLLGISVRTTQLWVEEGHLQAWKTPGGHRRILLDSVERLMQENRLAALTSPAPFGVLVLREEAEGGEALRGVLEHVLPDCQVATARNGFEALIRIGETHPEVLITDLGIAGLDFFSMIQALVTHARERLMLVVVLVASEADRAGVRQRLPEEVVVMGTPVDGHEIAVLVRAFLCNWQRQCPEARPVRAGQR